MNNLKIKFSVKLTNFLYDLYYDDFSLLARELMWISDSKVEYDNKLNINYLDLSKIDNCFTAVINGKKSSVSIAKFAKTYFPKISDLEVLEFIVLYNDKINEVVVIGDKIEKKEYTFNPRDVRSTFLSLVSKTYPMGHEDEVLQFLPKLTKDIHGNYFKIIVGDDTTMFTSHLDTADRKQVDTNLYTKTVNNEEFIFTDGKSVLGADDKAGVTTMLYMMSNNIPGLYYFFVGEERGGIGSRDLSDTFTDHDYLKNIKRCVSFDRRNTNSVIASQMGRNCCSEEFAKAMCEEYNKNGLSLSVDYTGIFTDSASFIDDINECTNISVGYNNEHTGKEIQNMTFLEKLCKASISVDWKSLPVVRKIGINSEVVRKYKDLISYVKKSIFMDAKIVGEDGMVFIKIDLEGYDINSIAVSLANIDYILESHGIEDAYVSFDDGNIKIELK